ATLQSATDQAILKAYMFVGEQLPTLMPMLFAFYAALRASGEALMDAQGGTNRDDVARAMSLLNEMLQAGPDVFATRFRLPLTLALLHASGPHMEEIVPKIWVSLRDVLAVISAPLDDSTKAVLQEALTSVMKRIFQQRS